MERLQLLMNAHSLFVDAAGLPEGVRPYSVQSRLETIQKSIMEEIAKTEQNTPPSPPRNNDDIPF